MTKTHHRFFIDPTSFTEGRVHLTDQGQVNQIVKVLRLKESQEIIVLDGLGNEFVVRLKEIYKKKIVGRIVETRASQGESKTLIRLFQGLPKQLSRFEEVLKHGTELGVSEFHPLITQNGENPELKKRPRLESILKESAEQSERGLIPVLGDEINFSDILKNGWPKDLSADLTLMAFAREEAALLSHVMTTMGEPKSINIIVGPVGGFTDDEIALAHKNKFTVFGLGPRVLRAETAGLGIVSALIFGGFLD